MKNRRSQRGFTLAELLIVVAIIGVLAGVSFVAVQTHQESLNQVELDTVAKEIYVAAQNHLTMAWNENYLGQISKGATDTEKTAFYGELGTVSTPDGELDEYYDKAKGDSGASRGVYHFYVQKGVTSPAIVNLILPPYALDGAVRGGNYLIRYQPDTGLVLDVFYAIASPTDKYHTDLPEYEALMSLRGEGKKNNRRSTHIGWYGGTAAASLPQAEPLEAPELEVENGDKLIAKITDKNAAGRTDYKIALLVTGKISQAQQVFKFEESNTRITNTAQDYEVVLDDITTRGMHFADIGAVNKDTPFIPGEDIVLRAVAYNEAALSNIANSDEKTVNSLFERADNANADGIEDFKNEQCAPIKAYINNIRHLENLSYEISWVDCSPISSRVIGAGGEDPKPMTVEAEQTTDLEWGKAGSIFTKGDDGVQIFKKGATVGGPAGCFLPVNIPVLYTIGPEDHEFEVQSSVSYDGQHHSIKGIIVNVAGSAGLFGDLPNDSSVKDLALIDFTVTSVSGSAGALAGTLTQNGDLPKDKAINNTIPNVSNVVAYNTQQYDAAKARAATITATNNASGDVGGLIGKVIGGKDKEGNAQTCTADIEKSAAALVVSSTGGNSGGLIGTMEGGTVEGCYSGGHTKDGSYYDGTTAIYNVTATAGTAGGLIGVATDMGNVSNCYSTCSATGTVAGGFVGTYVGLETATLENCYAAGLVCGTGKEENKITSSDGKEYKDLPTDGAFAYSLSGLAADNLTGCNYYEIINERVEHEDATDKTNVISANKPSDGMTSADSVAYLTAFGKLNIDGKDDEDNLYDIKALDASVGIYNDFVGAPSEWTKAVPYDSKLIEYYSAEHTYPDGVDADGKEKNKVVVESSFDLKGIKRLDSSLDDTAFVATHYGDWPAPEIFVVNAAS